MKTKIVSTMLVTGLAAIASAVSGNWAWVVVDVVLLAVLGALLVSLKPTPPRE